MAATSVPISESEGQVLMLLDSAGTILTGRDGRVRWALDAADVVVLLELGAEVAGAPLDPALSDRLGRLLGADYDW